MIPFMNRPESLFPLKADKHSPHTDKMSLRFDFSLLHFHHVATYETDLDASGKSTHRYVNKLSLLALTYDN